MNRNPRVAQRNSDVRRSHILELENMLFRNLSTGDNNKPRVNINRYSMHSYDGSFEIETKQSGGSCCQSCLTRIPYATLIATIMCLISVGIFCFTMYRASTLAVLLAAQVFNLRLVWLEAVQTIFVITGAAMAALGFMILCVGFLTTGATRHRVYKAWRTRVGGRISCAVFMVITYVLEIIWLLIFSFLVITTFLFTIFWSLCNNYEVSTSYRCIDFKQFYFMFPDYARPEDMEVCDHEIKLFCKDYVEKAEVMFILATVSSFLIILSLIHYMVCLSANYAHIRDHEKLQELQEMHYLTEPDLATSKDRF